MLATIDVKYYRCDQPRCAPARRRRRVAVLSWAPLGHAKASRRCPLIGGQSGHPADGLTLPVLIRSGLSSSACVARYLRKTSLSPPQVNRREIRTPIGTLGY